MLHCGVVSPGCASESPSVGPVSSRAIVLLGVLHLERFLRCSVFCASRAGAGVVCCALSGLRFLACGFWQASCGESFLLAVVLLWLLVHLCLWHGAFRLWDTCASLSLVVVPILLWGGYFSSSRKVWVRPSGGGGRRSVCCGSSASVLSLWFCLSRGLSVGLVTATVCSVGFCWRQSELLTGVSRVAIGNRVLCRVLLATEWVADWLVPTTRSVGGCSRVVFGWLFPLFGPGLASLDTDGVVVPSGRPFVWLELLTQRGGPSRFGCRALKAQAGYPFPLSLLFFPFPSSPAMGRLPSGDPGVVAPAARGGALERRRGARRRWPCVVKGPSWVWFFV
ncbi:hypothetical protein Taro_021228 [Colocasia esculenta]|uniref:Uncharacterized protein n=1 Tax=Colocasia esculenta TaxID=4460 RepID=A0A843V4R9_COLES|nr:hypothetical protein [Colocasia esculenta]